LQRNDHNIYEFNNKEERNVSSLIFRLTNNKLIEPKRERVLNPSELLLDKLLGNIQVKFLIYNLNFPVGPHEGKVSYKGDKAVLKSVDRGGGSWIYWIETSLISGFLDPVYSILIELEKHPEKSILLHNNNLPILSQGYHYWSRKIAGFPVDIKEPSDDISLRSFQEPEPKNTLCWSYPLYIENLTQVPLNTWIILSKWSPQLYSVILPFPGRKLIPFMHWHEGLNALKIDFFSFAPSVFSSYPKSPPLIIQWDKNPYKVLEKAYEVYAELVDSPILLRKNKELPPFLRKLGYCTWNAYLNALLGDVVDEVGKNIIKKGVNLGFFLLDDGWHQARDRRLLSFDTKFSLGLKDLSEKCKKYGIPYFGVWHTLHGYWNGIDPEDELKKYSDCFVKNKDGMYLPDPRNLKAKVFFREFYSHLKNWGVDFTKVDNQHYTQRYYYNILPTMAAFEWLHDALYDASQKTGIYVMNCMGFSLPAIVSGARRGYVTRCSNDYIPYWKAAARLHVYVSALCGIFVAPLMYPDYDMFQTHDPYGEFHALARAISGGPIYITDIPKKIRRSVIEKIALPDSSLPKLDDIAKLTSDCLFRDTYHEPYPLTLYNTIGDFIILASFNVYHKGESVKGEIPLRQFNLSEEKDYAVYSYYSDKVEVMSSNDVIKVELSDMETEVHIISPIEKNIALIGVKPLFIMPAGISDWSIEDFLKIRAKLKGTLILFSESSPRAVIIGNSELREGDRVKEGTYVYKNNLLKIPVRKDIEVCIKY